MLWNRTFGGPEDDWGHSVQQTTDGGYIIAGNTAFSSYLVKTDPEGDELWSRVFNMVNEGGYEEGGAECVQQTADGGYIVSGWSGYLEFSSGPNWVRGNVNILLFKIDSDGDLLWNRTFGGAEYHSGSSVQQTIDGGYIVVGIAHKQPNDVYLCKTDSYGNLLWDKTFGGSNNDYGYSVKQTTDGGYIIAGSTNSFGAGTLDVYLIKLAPRAEPTPEPSATPEPSSSPEPTPEPTPEQNPGGIPGFPYLAIVFGILLSLLIFKKIQS
jgi:hypothetical protein